jgi:hypothetical protein
MRLEEGGALAVPFTVIAALACRKAPGVVLGFAAALTGANDAARHTMSAGAYPGSADGHQGTAVKWIVRAAD